jgi:hypothetical protein
VTLNILKSITARRVINVEPIFLIAAIICIIAFLLVALSPRFAEVIYHPALFQPLKFPRGDWSLSWLNDRAIEDVYFPTAHGHKLHGWFLSAADAPATVLLHHGQAGNLADLHVLIDLLHRSGLNVFAYDYRGFGKSESSPSMAKICEDGVAAYDWLRARIGDQPIISYGESIGAAVACQVALVRRPNGIILQSGFYEMRRIACETYPIFHVWPAPLFAQPYFHNARALQQVHCPLLLLHGALDADVNVAHTHDLFRAAPDPKQLVVLPHTKHEEIDAADSELFMSSVKHFVAATVHAHP